MNKNFQKLISINGEWRAYDTIEDLVKIQDEEIQRLKELCNKYEEEHNTTFKEWQKDIQANKKAVKLLKEYRKDEDNYCDGNTCAWCEVLEHIQDVLQGSEDNEYE